MKDIGTILNQIIKVGSRVKVVSEIGRRSRVVEIRTNKLGTTLYILADGGWFHLSELETDTF